MLLFSAAFGSVFDHRCLDAATINMTVLLHYLKEPNSFSFRQISVPISLLPASKAVRSSA